MESETHSHNTAPAVASGEGEHSTDMQPLSPLAPQDDPARPTDASAAEAADGNAPQTAAAPPPPTEAKTPPASAGMSPTSGALVPRRAPGALQQVDTVSPIGRNVALMVGKAGFSIAKGILLSRRAYVNPVLSAALVAYDSLRAVSDYRRGKLNALGYQTTRTDLAFRLGKQVGLLGVGIGIGKAVGALVGLSAIPAVGQLVLATVVSVGVGVCVGTLLTRYIDRLYVQSQLRSQYGYPVDELGSRRRFEQLLEERHDLTSLECCKTVQHYADYRVASGWESPNDIDDYRATGDIRHMPVSFQHFAVVQLQRKWGFLSDRAACKKVFRLLILQHHPDRGGSSEMAALLNRDYEVYAFCQGWDEECQGLLHPGGDDGTEGGNHARDGGAGAEGRPKRRNAVADFLRSLFRSAKRSDVEAGDLHAFGLLALETGARSDPHRLGELEDLNEGVTGDDGFDATGGATPAFSPSGAAKQRSVARALAALQQTYQMTSETITFCGLVRAYEDTETWATLRAEAFLFNRLQCFVRVNQGDDVANVHAASDKPGTRDSSGAERTASAAGAAASTAPREHVCNGFRWQTLEEAVERREQARVAIIEAVFSKETSDQLETTLGWWRSAKSLAESYFKQCTAEREQETRGPAGVARATVPDVGAGDGAAQTLDTLLSIQRKLETFARGVRDPWKAHEGEWAASSLRGFSTRMDDMREVGLTASYALAGEYAKTLALPRKEECDTYFSAWGRKRQTIQTVLHELRVVTAERERCAARREAGAITADEADAIHQDLQQQTRSYTTQLVLLQQQQSEVDAKVEELLEVCSSHLPEAVELLSDLPSTCARCVENSARTTAQPRRMLYERERTLMSYQLVEPDAPNKMVPPADLREAYPESSLRFELFKAVHTDTLTGTVTSCWLKSYLFPDPPKVRTSLDDIDTGGDDDDTDADIGAYGEGRGEQGVPIPGSRTRHLSTQSQFLKQIMDSELTISEGCSSKYIIAPTDVFCDAERRQIFFQIPRGATQQRFSSVYDVRRHILPLGLRWLLDAMQCLIDLHSCQLSHGRVSLSSFTFDEFGNTALGFFEGARRLDVLRYTEESLGATEIQKDVVDFGAMVLAEVLPYLFGGVANLSAGSSKPASQGGSKPATSPTTGAASAVDDGVARILREVGERLIGKEEPRWTLLQARSFVRMCLQFNFRTDEGDYTFTKEVTYPPYWGPPRALLPQLVLRDRRVKLGSQPRGQAKVFLNINTALWRTYWACRRKMALGRMGTYSEPSAFKVAKPLLPCSDDCEVNERFMWYPCASEGRAWSLCQSGFEHVRRTPEGDVTYQDTALLQMGLTPDGAGTPAEKQGSLLWGVICRVAVGTVVSSSTNPSFVAAPRDAGASNDDKITYAAKRRSHLACADDGCGASATLMVPCPWARVYPEYVACIESSARL